MRRGGAFDAHALRTPDDGRGLRRPAEIDPRSRDLLRLCWARDHRARGDRGPGATRTEECGRPRADHRRARKAARADPGAVRHPHPRPLTAAGATTITSPGTC